MSDLLDKQQALLLRSLNRTLENFKKIGKNNLTPARVRSRVSALKELWADVQTAHWELLAKILPNKRTSEPYFTGNQYDLAEETYRSTADYMAECLEELAPPVSPNQSIVHNQSSSG